MAEKKSLETQVAKKKLEIEVKNFELSQFTYKYDENGVPINGQDFRQLQDERAKLNEEIAKLESSINRCDEYRNKLIDPIKSLPELPDDRVYIGIEKDKDINKEQPQKEETPKIDFELKRNQHSGKNIFETSDIIDNAKKDLEDESKDYSRTHLEPNEKIQKNPINESMRKNDKNIFETNRIINDVRREMGLESESSAKPTTPTDKKDKGEKSSNKITYIEIQETDGNIFYEDENGKEDKISIAEVLENKKS